MLPIVEAMRTRRRVMISRLAVAGKGADVGSLGENAERSFASLRMFRERGVLSSIFLSEVVMALGGHHRP
jgi:hypothetical protein